MHRVLPEAPVFRRCFSAVIVQTALFRFHAASAAGRRRLRLLGLGVSAAFRRSRRRDLLVFFRFAGTFLF